MMMAMGMVILAIFLSAMQGLVQVDSDCVAATQPLLVHVMFGQGLSLGGRLFGALRAY